MVRILLVLFAFVLLPVPVSAQTPESEPPGVQTIILDRAGIERVASASVEYQIAGLQLDGPVLYQFVITTFADGETAERALAVLSDEFATEMVAGMPDDVRTNADIDEASPPDVGDEQYAASMTIEQDVWTIQFGVVYVRFDRFIIGAAATGIMGNMILETVPYLESMIERIGGVDVSTEAGLTDALPALSDMPPGFTVSSGD